MATVDFWITNYLNGCCYRKHLDSKTIRTCQSDLNDLVSNIANHNADFLRNILFSSILTNCIVR